MRMQEMVGQLKNVLECNPADQENNIELSYSIGFKPVLDDWQVPHLGVPVPTEQQERALALIQLFEKAIEQNKERITFWDDMDQDMGFEVNPDAKQKCESQVRDLEGRIKMVNLVMTLLYGSYGDRPNEEFEDGEEFEDDLMAAEEAETVS